MLVRILRRSPLSEQHYARCCFTKQYLAHQKSGNAEQAKLMSVNRPLKSIVPDTIPARILLPVLLSMFLFIGTFFGYFLPKFEDHLMDRKREMIHALSESAMSSIQHYAKLAEDGVISTQEAKEQAASLLRNLRYGPEKKDYLKTKRK